MRGEVARGAIAGMAVGGALRGGVAVGGALRGGAPGA